MVIRMPPMWGWEAVGHAVRALGSAQPDEYWENAAASDHIPFVRRIGLRHLGDALVLGLQDLGEYRTDVLFLCVIYPLAGLLLARLLFGYDMLPLLFPLASGFALIGPAAAVGLNEMSRRLERGHEASLWDAFAVFRSPALGRILVMGGLLAGIYLFWLVSAALIYQVTLGPEPPDTIATFAHDVLYTRPGWTMIVLGVGLGFVLAVIVLAISVVAFPMLLDRNVPIETAIRTSIRMVRRNPVTMAAWGLIVAAGLIIGSVPVFLGMIVVMPVLGHATWHLYRIAVLR